MASRHLLCALLLLTSGTSALAANDGTPTGDPGLSGQTGAATSGPTCRQASKAKHQLTAEEKARRKALRAQQAAMGITPAAKPHKPKLPLC